MRRVQVGIIGSAGSEEYAFEKPLETTYTAAEKLGIAAARQKWIVITGGKGGIMEAAARGAKSAGGITAAETSGIERSTSNRFTDVEIVTGDLAFRGPSQLVGMCDGVIALGGGAGTLQELAVAYRLRKPTVLLTGFGGWTDRVAALEWLDERRLVKFVTVDTPAEAIKVLKFLIQSKQEGK